MAFDTGQEVVIVLIFASTVGWLTLALYANWQLQESVKYWRSKALEKGLDK